MTHLKLNELKLLKLREKFLNEIKKKKKKKKKINESFHYKSPSFLTKDFKEDNQAKNKKIVKNH